MKTPNPKASDEGVLVVMTRFELHPPKFCEAKLGGQANELHGPETPSRMRKELLNFGTKNVLVVCLTLYILSTPTGSQMTTPFSLTTSRMLLFKHHPPRKDSHSHLDSFSAETREDTKQTPKHSHASPIRAIYCADWRGMKPPLNLYVF